MLRLILKSAEGIANSLEAISIMRYLETRFGREAVSSIRFPRVSSAGLREQTGWLADEQRRATGFAHETTHGLRYSLLRTRDRRAALGGAGDHRTHEAECSVSWTHAGRALQKQASLEARNRA